MQFVPCKCLVRVSRIFVKRISELITESCRTESAWCNLSVTRSAYILFLGILLVGLGSYAETGSAGANPATIEEAKSMLGKETFLGQSKNGVLKFLDAWKWEHNDSSSTVVAVIRNARRSNLILTSIKITFHFDDRGFLREVAYEDMLTGP